MPTRVFRNFITNSVPGHTLVLEQEVLCGGEWTSDEWRPPARIVSGQKLGWQSESDGFMTGTEGWVKYNVVRDSNQSHHGLVYLYWTNPYLGVTYPKMRLAGHNITADCKEETPGATSDFGDNDPPRDLQLKVVGARKGEDPCTIDEVGDLARIAIAPFVIIGTMGIWARMEIDYELTSSEEQLLLPPAKPRTKSVEMNPKPSTFVGNWTGDGVSASVAMVGYRTYTVLIDDRTGPLPFHHQGEATLGSAGASRPVKEYLDKTALGLGAEEGIPSVLRSTVALAAIAASIRAQDPEASTPWFSTVVDGQPASAFSRGDLTSAANSLGVKSSLELDKVGAAVAAFSRRSRYTLLLGHNVSLYLVRAEEAGQLVDYQLHYQRLDDNGEIVSDKDLTYRPSVH